MDGLFNVEWWDANVNCTIVFRLIDHKRQRLNQKTASSDVVEICREVYAIEYY